jgi:hypothetical protein
MKGLEPHGFRSNPGGFVRQVPYGLKQFVALVNQGCDVKL